jgi:hypothetical protein
LQATHANALVGHAHTAGVPQARRVELMHSAIILELLPAAMASCRRRLAAGTLLAGACRTYEVAWCAATMAHDQALAANNVPNAEEVYAPHTAEAMSAWSSYVGYDAHMRTAGIALQLCVYHTDVDLARVVLSLPEATAVACSIFVESALDIMQLHAVGTSMIETTLVRNAQIAIEEDQRFRATCEWHARILAAWRRLQSSGVLQRRSILQGVSFVAAHNAHQTATAGATAAVRGLHFCALHSCGAQEVHASQFKRCSACLGVVYCCKERQVQDWPAHKAACRAARKAAEAADDEASGA